ncbi:thiamine pyrophosphate-dependent enzyme [Flagellimonas marina]|uniref:Thiamine pyrophosphate-dependent enzyme n=1 Tax=Flagellimonas marina TaxID=1775168 RepID=A0ABV8PKY9_9FLAO
MKTQQHIITNANQAVAHIAYRINDVFPIYPITPSSEMSELVEEWSARQQKNIFGNVPSTFEMQSEAGVAGAMHGALQTGSLSSTFTASQGLLLMMPNMYKIAAELSPNVIHVATRSVAAHALSVFGDHSDVMAVRSTGYGMLASASVQEAMDFALISQAASLESRIPFVHFFDGFRTSNEVSKIEKVSDGTINRMIDADLVAAHRNRALNPNSPVLRGTSQGADVFFQSREAVNTYYEACPNIVQQKMDDFAKLTGRQYKIFEYVGHPEAEHIIIAMASATETIEETINYLNDQGEKVGLVKVRLYRPFSAEHFMNDLPKTCKAIAVLDRTKEPGSTGEPLFLDVMQTVVHSERFSTLPKMVGGRYGLSSKEFTPGMVKSILDNLKKANPKNNFTVGITDDVTQLSLPKSKFELPKEGIRVLFYEIKGSDTVMHFNNFIQQMGKEDQFVQGYQECDYKKSNSRSVTHFRMAKERIKAPYLISNADFIGCTDVNFLENDTVLQRVKQGGTIVVQSKENPTQFWNKLSLETKKMVQEKEVLLYTINPNSYTDGAISILHLGYMALINNVGEENKIMDAIHKVNTSRASMNQKETLLVDADFSKTLLGQLLVGRGNEVPVSALSVDGTYPTNTSQFSQRTFAEETPEWLPDLCTQCGACSLACPSGALRMKVYGDKTLLEAPSTWKAIEIDTILADVDLLNYTIQVNPDQCTSCNSCVDACPAKALVMGKTKIVNERKNWNYFETIPEVDRERIDNTKVSQQQLQEPLFKYPMGEDGCGEAPYLKLMSQLFGDRALVANATGASSIFGGALPTTPWAKNQEGRGPAWSNSLFEDNAEFGLGFRLSLDLQEMEARELLQKVSAFMGDRLIRDILNAKQNNEREINQQRSRIEALKSLLEKVKMPEARKLAQIADSLVKKSVWIVGGDGWAYDIGYGGLDHVLASGKNVNILVLDNEVYSNTGNQMSKATPYGASARFAATGKQKQKKDLGALAMHYNDVYVASVAIGANQEQTLKAFVEAEAHDGPSLIIAYCHSPAHGIDMKNPSKYHKMAVESGQWLLYRNDPNRAEKGLATLQLDSDAPSIGIEKYFQMENRFKHVFETDPKTSWQMIQHAQHCVNQRFEKYQRMASPITLGMSLVEQLN